MPRGGSADHRIPLPMLRQFSHKLALYPHPQTVFPYT